MSGAVVELSDAVVRFGRLRVLDEVSVSLDAGDVVAVRGRNGSGKTTLLRTLAGVMSLAAGRRTGPRRCAYVPALIEPPVLTAGRWLRTMPRAKREDPGPILEVLGFTGDLSRSCRVLSFGNLRKLMIAEALSSSPQLVVIDEATIGLDTPGITGLTALVATCRDRGGAVVLADQHGRPTLGADTIFTVSAGNLLRSVTEGREVRQDDVEITLTGPADHLDRLRAQAALIGFTASRPDT